MSDTPILAASSNFGTQVVPPSIDFHRPPLGAPTKRTSKFLFVGCFILKKAFNLPICGKFEYPFAFGKS